MDLGGILAGAMAGGGKALQFNAQNQLERQREEALAKLERNFARENLEYEYNRKAEIQQAEAAADEAAAIRDAQIEIGVDAAKNANEERISGGSISYGDAYSRAMERADEQYNGLVEIAANPMNRATGDVSAPDYNRIAANSLRAEARATRDPEVADQLMRQADQLESRSGSSVTGESGGMGGSGGDLVDPGALNLDFN